MSSNRPIVKKAQASYDEANASYQRYSSLYAKQTVSKASLETARARRDTAEAALRTAKQQLDYTVVKAPYSGYVTKRLVQVGEEVRPGQPLISGISLKRVARVGSNPAKRRRSRAQISNRPM